MTAGAPSAASRVSPGHTYRIKAPISAEPGDVVAALAENAEVAGEILAAHLWLEDTPSATLRLVAAWGQSVPDSTPVEIQSTTLGRALSSGSPTLKIEKNGQEVRGSSLVWRYAVPVETGDARGVAAVDLAGTKPDRTVLENTTAGMRPALTGALAIHVAHQQSSAAHVLLEAARDLSRLVDEQAVTATLLQRAVDMANADTGSVMLIGEDGALTIAAATGLPDDVVAQTRVSEGEGIAGWVYATRKPLVVEDLAGSSARSRRHGIRSAVSVPIGDEDGVLGVLNVGSRTFSARFSRSHMDALESLGMIGAVALRGAQAVVSSRDLYFDTLKALALALETKDPYARGTTEKVLAIATELGERMGLGARTHQALRVAALLHDVGMAAVGEAAAVGDRPLSTVEWGLLKMHPVIAADVISQAPALRDAVPIVYHHHEHYDGGGYVGGLAGDAIPIGARVLAVADAFVAMTSDRPYRRALSDADALREIETAAGTQFDPAVVERLIETVGRPEEPVAVE
jgi:HD-GYP domain-containing protein (c-di-GMP phosphodiesterase class II)